MSIYNNIIPNKESWVETKSSSGGPGPLTEATVTKLKKDSAAYTNGFWLRSLYMNWEKSDIKIYVGEDKEKCTALFPGHSLVLRCQSEFFNTMLSENKFIEGTTNTVKLLGFKARTFEYFLRYLYCGYLPDVVPFHHVQDLMRMSHQYDVKTIFEECCMRLQNSVTVSTACETYQLSYYLEAAELRKTCEKIIKKNLSVIFENDLFLGLDLSMVFSFTCQNANAHLRNAYRRIANYNFYIGEAGTTDGVATKFLLDSTGSPYNEASRLRYFGSDLYLDKKFSDLDLVVVNGHQEAHFPVHSLVLISQSEPFQLVWKNLVQTRIKDEQLQFKLEDKIPRIVEHFLGFLYLQYFPNEISDKNAMLLLTLAQEYQVEKLVKLCQERVVRKLTASNLCEIMSLASKIELSTLQEICLTKLHEIYSQISLENFHHFDLDIEEMAEFNCLKSDADAGLSANVLQEWAKWRLCLDGIEADSEKIDSLVDEVL